MPAPVNFLEAQDVFAAKLKGYTRRAHQIALAECIEQAVSDGAILMAQAGTGTGKSFALMIPSVLSGKRTIVAVPTKALQDQYVGDLTFLEEHLGADFKWAILKGRSNYPCWVKREALQSPTYGQRLVIKAMDENADPREGKIIDRESFPELTRADWAAFSMSADECPGAKDCPFAEQCFTERAKARAAEASVVVTNLAYLLHDLKLRMATEDNVSLLGPVEQLVIDEAHMLPEATTSALEDTMGEFTFKVLARDLAQYLFENDRDEDLATEIERVTERLWERLVSTYATWAKGDPKVTDPMPLTVMQLIDPDAFGDLFIDLYQAIEVARDELKAIRPDADDDREVMRRSRLMRRTANTMQRIMDYTTDPAEKTVRWTEPEDKVVRGERIRRFSFRSAPVKVGPFLRRAIWDVTPTVLSSATLTGGVKRVNGQLVPDFFPLMDLMGLRKDEARTYNAGSPFNFGQQAMLYMPEKDIPDPKSHPQGWRAYTRSATHYLVTKSGGGALLLFTSKSAMKESYEALAPQFQAAGLHVMIQDGDIPSTQLIKAMKEDGNAVLFALRTFFQGIDVQGRALRLVVIDKLPFPVPSDLVYKAREEELNKRYNDQWRGFNQLMIPGMILDLTQAFGRLIRHADDYGVVAILDSRLSSKRYGKQIIDALPPAKLTTKPEEAALFLESIGTGPRAIMA